MSDTGIEIQGSPSVAPLDPSTQKIGTDEVRGLDVETLRRRSIIRGTEGPDIIFTTSKSDRVLALGGDDIIYGSLGRDFINGGDGKDTVDYQLLNQAITLLPQGAVGNGSQLQSIEVIKGKAGLLNAIDASASTDSRASISVDLSSSGQSVTVQFPTGGSQTLELANFVNVTGTAGNDKIVNGATNSVINGGGGDDTIDSQGKLTGGAGNDSISGGADDNIINGTDSTALGVGEKDTLTGREGGDRFVVGEGTSVYYRDSFLNSDPNGERSFAYVTDLSPGDQIQLAPGNYKTEFGDDGTYTVSEITQVDGMDVGTGLYNDLILKAQFTGFSAARKASVDGKLSVESVTSNDLPQGEFSIASGQQIGFLVGA
jgi:Ca2+-binding RTX toxin-like protein